MRRAGREPPEAGGGLSLLFPLVRDASRYAFAGVCATVIDYAAYLALVRVFELSPPPAQAVSRALGGLASFLGHRFWTFRDRIGPAVVRPFVRFWTVWAVMYGLAIAAVALFSRWVPQAPVLAKLLADMSVVLVTFALQRHWTFARAARGEGPSV